ncbi:MAG: PilZ domain-containing protein [Thermodesulfobacteriota bacterium]
METRQYCRLDRPLVLSLRRQGSQAPFCMAQSQDLSQGGLCLVCEQCLPPGAHLELVVQFPFRLTSRVRLSGRVTSCTEVGAGHRRLFRLGVAFCQLPSDLFLELSLFLDRLAAQRAPCRPTPPSRTLRNAGNAG